MTGGTGERWAAGGLAREYPDESIKADMEEKLGAKPFECSCTHGHPGCCHRPKCQVGASGGDREAA